MRSKITVVGAGNVGATLCQRLAERNYADLVLVDIVEGLPQGKALDMLQAGPIAGYDTLITGSNGYDETAGSDVVLITSGVARKPGMSRDDLVMTNAKVICSVVDAVVRQSPGAVLIMVTNPLDAMAQVGRGISRLPRERLLGMAGVLDTARFRTSIAQELRCSVLDIQAFVVGGHGDTMVPLTGFTTVAGVPVTKLIGKERLDAIVQRARDGGAEILNLLKTTGYYAPSAAAAQMVDAVILDTRQTLPCSVYMEGEYGISGLYTGVPCRLGAGGLTEVVSMDLAAGELAALHRSAAAVQEVVDIIDARRGEIDARLPALGSGARIGDTARV